MAHQGGAQYLKYFYYISVLKKQNKLRISYNELHKILHS